MLREHSIFILIKYIFNLHIDYIKKYEYNQLNKIIKIKIGICFVIYKNLWKGVEKLNTWIATYSSFRR